MINIESPNIIIDFEIDAELVFISIKNLSNYPALNVKIKPSQKIIGLEGKKNITELSVFNEIKYLAPHKEIKIFIDTFHSFFKHLKRTEVYFTMSYTDEAGKAFNKKILHDLNIYKDLIFFIKKH